MQSEYKKFKKLLESKQVYVDELKADNEGKEKELISLDESYKQALISNNDKQADKYEDDIYNLKKFIKRNEVKLSLVYEADPELEAQAMKVLTESNQAIDELNESTKKKAENYHDLRKELISIVSEIQKAKLKVTPYQASMRHVIKILPRWAENEASKAQSKTSWNNFANGTSTGDYNQIASSPILKPLLDTEIRRAQAEIKEEFKKEFKEEFGKEVFADLLEEQKEADEEKERIKNDPFQKKVNKYK